VGKDAKELGRQGAQTEEPNEQKLVVVIDVGLMFLIFV
jgi:hypothetical protein